MATPSKLDILRAAGQVQREIAAEVHASDSANVTTRRRNADPVVQLAGAQEELDQVKTSLKDDERLLHRLRGTRLTDVETEFEDAMDDVGGGLGDAVDGDQGGLGLGGDGDGIEDDAASRSGATPQFDLPPDSPFTQDWFAKMIGAAVAAAASATSAPSSVPQRSSKLKITDKKLPDFWEWQPVAWFRLFDRHVKPFKPSQAETFDALLPLLSTAACKHVQPIVRSPGLDPYSRARSSLIRHFDKTPRDHARECRRLDSLGDMMPSDMLEHILGLLPDPAVIYEVIFLDLLPPAARDAALQHSSLSAMAAAADKIVREGSTAATAGALSVSVVAEDPDPGVAAISSRRQAPSSRQRADQRPSRGHKFLCSVHARWGKNSFRCADPSSCHMKDIIRPRQDGLPPTRPSSGNGRAGGQ